MRTNTLSAFGRMSYGAHLAFYPAAALFTSYIFLPWYNARVAAAEKGEWDAMVDKKKVDPDLFNPFTPVPYHNNPELKYVFAGINMRNYVNENHINVKEYAWKNYHNSYDHNNEKTYLFNWTRM